MVSHWPSRPPNRNALQPAGLRAGSDWLVNYQQSGDFTFEGCQNKQRISCNAVLHKAGPFRALPGKTGQARQPDESIQQTVIIEGVARNP
jgi:hypothetical protein